MRTPLGKDGLQTLLSVKVQQKHVDKWLAMSNHQRNYSHNRCTKNPFSLAVNDELAKKHRSYIDDRNILVLTDRRNFDHVEYTHQTPLEVSAVFKFTMEHNTLECLVGMLISFPIPTSLLKTRSKKPCSQPPTPTSL